MADLKKQLKLVASLDDSAIRKQLQSLKRELGKGVSLETQDLGDIKKTFSDIAKDFSNQLKSALKNVQVNAIKSPELMSGMRSSGVKTGRIPSVGQVNDQAWDEFYKAQDKAITEEAKSKKKTEEEISRKKEAALKKELKDREAHQKNLNKEIAAAYTNASEKVKSENLIDRLGGPAAAAKAGLGIAGAAGGAGIGIMQLQRTLLERQQRPLEDIMNRRYIEGVGRQAGRERFLPKAAGFLAGVGGGAAAGAGIGATLGSVIPGLGTAAGAGVGGTIGGLAGGIYGTFKGSSIAGELGSETVKFLQKSFDKAAEVMPQRLAMLRGGGVTSQQLTQMQTGAAELGIGPQESIQQALQARQALGNRAGMEAIPEFQRVFAATGLEVGQQSRFLETMRGAETRNVSAQSQTQILERALSRGVDASKLTKFTQVSNDLLEQTIGQGRINTEALTTRFTELSRAFAEGGPITDTALRQAATLQQREMQESMSTTGLSGLGNVLATQELMSSGIGKGLGQGAFFDILGAKEGTTSEDFKKMLTKAAQDAGISDEDLTAFSERAALAKTGVRSRGEQAIGGGGLARFVSSREVGISTAERFREQEKSIEARVEAAIAKPGGTQIGQMIPTGPEFELTKAEAKLDAAQVSEGFGQFGVAIDQANKGLVDFAKEVNLARKELESYKAQLGINRQVQ